MAYFISHIYRIDWWTRIILLALIKTNPVFPSTWLYVSPLIAIIVGYIILGEPLNPTMGMGACLILIGVFWPIVQHYGLISKRAVIREGDVI